MWTRTAVPAMVPMFSDQPTRHLQPLRGNKISKINGSLDSERDTSCALRPLRSELSTPIMGRPRSDAKTRDCPREACGVGHEARLVLPLMPEAWTVAWHPQRFADQNREHAWRAARSRASADGTASPGAVRSVVSLVHDTQATSSHKWTSGASRMLSGGALDHDRHAMADHDGVRRDAVVELEL
jgi:hypothetical protein